MDRLRDRLPRTPALAAGVLMLGLVPAAQAASTGAASAATTPTVTTPASAKIGQPTTITPTPTRTAPSTTTPGTTTPSATTPAVTAPAATAPATPTTPAATTPPPTTAPTTTSALPGANPASSAGASGLLARGQRAPKAHKSKKISTEAIVLAALAAFVLLICAAWAFARSRAYEPRWMLSLRHAMSEAGFRLSATWAEFSDWVRLGR